MDLIIKFSLYDITMVHYNNFGYKKIHFSSTRAKIIDRLQFLCPIKMKIHYSSLDTHYFIYKFSYIFS